MNSEFQYIYLTRTNDNSPLGVLAFKKEETNPERYVFAGSMVSTKDPFEKKVGVAKAVGRLNSKNKRVVLGKGLTRQANIAQLIAHELKLEAYSSGTFHLVNWRKADQKLNSALDIFEQKAQPAEAK